MKYLMIILTLMSTQSQAVEKDKKLHFAASTAISSAIYSATNDKKKAFYGCMAIGLAKEISDEFGGSHLSGKDLITDSVGCLLGSNIKISTKGVYLSHTFRF